MAFIRESITKKVRFDVFKRDAFICQYCGNSPPSVVLEIDHITPVSKGGKSNVDNLITACFDCNRGKSSGLLTNIPAAITEKLELIKEKEDQLKAYNRLLKRIKVREQKDVESIEAIFNKNNKGNWFSPEFEESVKRNFLRKIPVYELIIYMENSCSKMASPERAIKYFCGICWNVIRAKENG